MSSASSTSARRGETKMNKGLGQTKRDLRAATEEIKTTGASYQGTHTAVYLHNSDSESDHAVMVSKHALPDNIKYCLNGCSCQDWTFRQPSGGCKHMKAIREVVEPLVALANDSRVTEGQIRAMMDVPDSVCDALIKTCAANDD